MRHGRALRKLGRTTAHRMSLLRNLSTAFFDKERITTTLTKAKELRPYAERLITLARRDTLHSRRQAARSVQDKAVLKKLFSTLGPRFAQRHGGYSRILKLGWRQGDGAEMAILELIGSEPVFKKDDKKGKTRRARKKAAEDAEAAAEAAKSEEKAETAAAPETEKPKKKATPGKTGARPAGKGPKKPAE